LLVLNEYQLDQLRKSGIPDKTRSQTEWGIRVWRDWSIARNHCSEDIHIPSEFVVAACHCDIDKFMSHFVTEFRWQNGLVYPPLSLHQLCCSLQRAARFEGVAINLFEDKKVLKFQATLDAEMKRLSVMGMGMKKQVQPIGAQEDERLWQLGLLGDHSAQALVDTIVFQMGLFFALRSGQEHRRLHHANSQVKLFEPPSGRPHLVYQENKSKTGIKHMKKMPKQVTQYANLSDPSRCVVRL